MVRFLILGLALLAPAIAQAQDVFRYRADLAQRHRIVSDEYRYFDHMWSQKFSAMEAAVWADRFDDAVALEAEAWSWLQRRLRAGKELEAIERELRQVDAEIERRRYAQRPPPSYGGGQPRYGGRSHDDLRTPGDVRVLGQPDGDQLY